MRKRKQKIRLNWKVISVILLIGATIGGWKAWKRNAVTPQVMQIDRTQQIIRITQSQPMATGTTAKTYGVNVNGKVTLNGPSALARIILTDTKGTEYIIYETYSAISDKNQINFTNACEETCILNGVVPKSVRTETESASIEIIKTNYVTNAEGIKDKLAGQSISNARARIAAEKNKEKLVKLKANIAAKGKKWTAGETSISKLSYQDKKKLFGVPQGTSVNTVPNLQGFEYYTGGIFEVPIYSSGAIVEPIPLPSPTSSSPVRPSPSLRPSLPPNCYYKQVWCIKAPCEPIVVCSSPNPSPVYNSPIPSIYPSPSATSSARPSPVPVSPSPLPPLPSPVPTSPSPIPSYIPSPVPSWIPSPSTSVAPSWVPSPSIIASPLPPQSSAFPLSWDWRNRHGQNWITPVRNQMGCGSCWAFGAIGSTEAQINLYFNQHLDIDLSEQDSVCRHPGSCAAGGFFSDTFDELKSTGIVTESCYPYTGTEACPGISCTDPVNNRWHITDFKWFHTWPLDDTTMRSALVTKGPFPFGILSWWHIMTLVAYDTDKTTNETIWTVKNSWGADWGQGGFGQVKVGLNDRYSSGYLETPYKETNNPTKVCTDNDKDTYCNWGISETKPSSCAKNCKPTKDCNDSDPRLGPFSSNYSCTPIRTRSTF